MDVVQRVGHCNESLDVMITVIGITLVMRNDNNVLRAVSRKFHQEAFFNLYTASISLYLDLIVMYEIGKFRDAAVAYLCQHWS